MVFKYNQQEFETSPRVFFEGLDSLIEKILTPISHYEAGGDSSHGVILRKFKHLDGESKGAGVMLHVLSDSVTLLGPKDLE